MLHDIELRNELEAIRVRFVKRIEEWLPGIEAVRADLDVGMFTKSDLKGLRNRLHKIAGSAGSFGFASLSGAASDLERHFDMMRLAGHGIGAVAGLLPYFDVFLDEARKLITIFHGLDLSKGSQVAKLIAGPVFKEPPSILAILAEKSEPFQPLIMIVDDDDLMRSYLATGLAPNDWSFIEAENGQKAIDLLNKLTLDPRRRFPDLIIMDVEMPEMDGFTALGKIKDLPGCQNIPIMMLTARDEDLSFIRGYARGALEYLTKPIELSVLEKVVKDLLRQTVAQ